MRLLFPGFLLLLASACQQQVAITHHEKIAGIDHSLWIYDTDTSKARRAISATFSELRLLSNFTEPVNSKPISRTNALLRSREWFSVNPSVTHILKRSIEYYNKTDGLYNPVALGVLREKWGLYNKSEELITPKEKDLQQFLADLPTMNDIEFDGIRLRSRNSHMRLDFDYLAYGNAIDIEMQHLQELGIQNARLRIGPVESVIGIVPDGDATPLVNSLESGQSACKRQIPLATGEIDSSIRHDVIDTKTGHPIDHVKEITVVANSARNATIACWTLMVSSPANRQGLTEKLGVILAIVIDADGQKHEYRSK